MVGSARSHQCPLVSISGSTRTLLPRSIPRPATHRLPRNIRAALRKPCRAAHLHEDYTATVKTVLAAIDFSPVSRKIVAEAAKLACAIDGRVVLVTVLVAPVFLEEFAPPPPSIARVLVGTEPTARRRLAVFEKRLTAAAIPATSVLLNGSPAERILQQARKLKPAYLVIGSHGHSAFYDLVVGSTTHLVLKHARGPVLVIPSHPPKLGRTRR